MLFFFANFHVSFTEKRLLSGYSEASPQWSLAVMVVLLEVSPISTQDLWSSARVTIGFLVTSLTKALLSRLFTLAGQPALGRVLVVANLEL